MPKITFMIIITLTAILSLAVVGNAFAKSSGGDSGGSGGSGGSSDGSDNKPKTSGHKKGDSSGSGGMPVPGLPLPKGVDNKHKDSNSGGLIVPGLPVVRSDGNDHDDGGGSSYNNGNIKKFDTSKSSFRISGSGSEIVQYMPGFNETFYNSTLPYCFAVTSGSCYDSSTGQVTP